MHPNSSSSDFGGQWDHHFRNVYAYVGNCFGDGHNLAFYDNHCVTMSDGFGCPSDPTMTVRNNTVYTHDGKGPSCKGTSKTYPSDADLVAMGMAVLQPFPMPSTIVGGV